MERKKRMLTGLAAAGILAGALAGGGVALAGTASSAPPASTVAALAAAPASKTPVTGTAAKGAVRFLRRARAARLILRTSASFLGLTPAELLAQLHAGKTLASVAAAQGKSVSGLENVIVAAAVNRIDASRLTAARKARLISLVRANVGPFVNAVHPFKYAARRLAQAAGNPGASGPGASTPAASTPAASTAAA
jgi:hypothetical protein